MNGGERSFAPGVAEALAAQGADMAGLVKVESAKVKATFLPGKARSEAIDLDYPLEVDGVVYAAIWLKRMTAGEVAAFIESIKDSPAEARPIFPIFRDAEDRELPRAVLEALDDDDMTRLNEAALGFLPRRFGGGPASDTIPATGASTAP